MTKKINNNWKPKGDIFDDVLNDYDESNNKIEVIEKNENADNNKKEKLEVKNKFKNKVKKKQTKYKTDQAYDKYDNMV